VEDIEQIVINDLKNVTNVYSNLIYGSEGEILNPLENGMNLKLNKK
jgi:hypothetical protein